MLGRLATIAAASARRGSKGNSITDTLLADAKLSEKLIAQALPRNGLATSTSISSPTPTIAPELLEKARKMSPPVGLLAGTFGALVGVGGGVIIVPTIVNACKTIPQRLVSGTSLAAVVSTAAVSAATFAQSGCVDIAAAAIISPIAMMTAPLGARMTTKLNCSALRRTLGIFLCCVAPLVPLKAILLSDKTPTTAGADGNDNTASSPSTSSTSTSVRPVASSVEESSADIVLVLPTFSDLSAIHDRIISFGPATIAALAGTGAVAGFASGLLGIGGGTIVTPLLAITQPYGQATVLGTSLLAMIAPSLAALAQHARLGNVDLRMALGLALGTAVGGAVGSTVAVQAPPGALEAVFAFGIFFLGRKTLATAK